MLISQPFSAIQMLSHALDAWSGLFIVAQFTPTITEAITKVYMHKDSGESFFFQFAKEHSLTKSHLPKSSSSSDSPSTISGVAVNWIFSAPFFLSERIGGDQTTSWSSTLEVAFA